MPVTAKGLEGIIANSTSLSNELGEPKWIRMSERIASIMKEK